MIFLYTIGEELVKPAALKMAEIMCGQKEAMKLNSALTLIC
jgi:hypothetical protein